MDASPFDLHCHPGTPCAVDVSLNVRIVRTGDGLELRYAIEGALERLRLPAFTGVAPGGRLWEHSCFEAFLRPEGGEAYLELNVAPGGAWAAYALEGYRRGLQELPLEAPELRVRRGAGRLELTARVVLPPAFRGPCRLGLSAVLEDLAGGRSYWALHHPPEGDPDFHCDAAFAARLGA